VKRPGESGFFPFFIISGTFLQQGKNYRRGRRERQRKVNGEIEWQEVRGKLTGYQA